MGHDSDQSPARLGHVNIVPELRDNIKNNRRHVLNLKKIYKNS